MCYIYHEQRICPKCGDTSNMAEKLEPCHRATRDAGGFWGCWGDTEHISQRVWRSSQCKGCDEWSEKIRKETERDREKWCKEEEEALDRKVEDMKNAAKKNKAKLDKKLKETEKKEKKEIEEEAKKQRKEREKRQKEYEREEQEARRRRALRRERRHFEDHLRHERDWDWMEANRRDAKGQRRWAEEMHGMGWGMGYSGYGWSR